MNPLHSLICRTVQANGKITFAEYMAEALYHPELGYYNRPEMTIGERGDFYTAPMVHPVFGQCIARLIHQLWQQLGSPATFTVLEMGAGTGALARQILTEWEQLNPGPVNLQYVIVEQSPVLRQKQREETKEAAAGRIAWFSFLQEVAGFGSLTGVVISNELFDALPVHHLEMDNGQLQERFVTLLDQDGVPQLAETTGPLSDDKLPFLLGDQVLSALEDGDQVTVCPAASQVIGDMADALQQGFVITIDYGDRSPDVYWKSVRTGGIRCYYKQSLVKDPYQRIGEQDITADVDFSLLQREGKKKGLRTVSFSTQSEFLEKWGFLDKVAEFQRLAFKDLRADFELQKMLTLYLPQGLGDACKVLIQEK